MKTKCLRCQSSPESSSNSTGTSQQRFTGSPIKMPLNPGQNMVQTQSKPTSQDRIFSPAPSQAPPKSFIQTSVPTLVQVTPGTQPSDSDSTSKPAINVAPKETRKILLYMIIVFIVVLLIVMFIVLKNFVQHSSSSLSDQRYAIVTQVCNYEQNISLCITSTSSHPHTWLWTRRTGVPSTISISERMVGSRI